MISRIPQSDAGFNPNAIINGDFSIWQMGTTSTPAPGTGHTACDMWSYSVASAASFSYSRQAAGLDGFEYCMRHQRTAAAATLGTQFLCYDIGTPDSIPFAAKSCLLSFWARAGANYSAASSSLFSRVAMGTGTNQTRRSVVYTGETTVDSTLALTTTWQLFTIPVAVPAGTTEIGFLFYWIPTGVAGAADYVELLGVGFAEALGTRAGVFQQLPYTERLARCQHRLFKTFPIATAPAQASGSAVGCYRFLAVAGGAITLRGPHFPFPVTQRIVPAITTYNPINANANAYDDLAAVDAAMVSTTPSEHGVRMVATGNAGSAAGSAPLVHFLADARL